MKETPLELKFIDQVFYDECTYMLEHIKLAAWTMYLVLKKKKNQLSLFVSFANYLISFICIVDFIEGHLWKPSG